MAKGGQRGSSGPELKTAMKLYETGDVVAARREAAAVLTGSASDLDKKQAADLLERTRFPRMGLILAAVAGGLILLMVLLARLRA